jgi:hypothetical protein
MAVYKIFAEADATIYSRFPKQNTGLDEMLEVAVKNTDNTGQSANPSVDTISSDDIRRSLIKFSDSGLDKLKTFRTGSWKTFLRTYVANAENLTKNYTLEIRQVSQSWEMGTGQFDDSPETKNGVNWYNTASWYSETTDWVNPSYYLTSGGGSWTNTYVTQSFDYEDSKDVCADVTDIVTTWFNGSESNNGFLLKHPTAIENNSGSYIALSYYSNDTHTIYPPTLEIRWDDSRYITGSLQQVDSTDSVITISNNKFNFSAKNELYKVKINCRDKYPARVFTTSSLYTVNKRLPSQSYWSIIDAKTNEVVVDFDSDYTKISCDGTSSYFNVYFSGLEPERYYKFMVKSDFDSGESFVFDDNMIFKVYN